MNEMMSNEHSHKELSIRDEAKENFGGVHNPNLPTSRLPSSSIGRQTGLSTSVISNTALMNTIDIRWRTLLIFVGEHY